MEEKIHILTDIIRQSERIVFFGGAGVSTESGIPDFRSADGIFMQSYKYSPEQIVSHSFFMEKTEAFYEFYKLKMLFPKACPNSAHLKLAELEREGKLMAVITQNIDGLHQMAGSKNVLELHGSVHRNYCQKCGKEFTLSYVKDSEGIPLCNCGGIIKPDVVLYEENLDAGVMNRSVEAIRNADTLIIGDTSLNVYPAAGFIDYFQGKHLVVINRDAAVKSVDASLEINDSIGKIMEQILIDNC